MSGIDLSDVVTDPDLAESYTIQRSTGSFEFGGWVTTPSTIPGYGVVSVATEQDLEMIPEGDRVTGSMVFHSEARIYETQLDGAGGITVGATTQRVSDKILWNYQLYRVLHVSPYPNRNFWKAVAVRMAGI
jgi:hypothetical protein